MTLPLPQLQTMAYAIRFLAVDAIVKAKEGHQGVPLGMAEIATALFTQHLKFCATQPTWFDRDRFVLSNGHGSMLLYALLYLSGYSKISRDQLESFRELGSHCAGHPEYDPAAGIEVTTGPLGQGIGNALGMAIAESYLRARFGSDLVDHHTYVFVGDGCLQEGVGQEMISLAGHLKLNKLMMFWDDNCITDDGSTNLSISENVAERLRVAGWHVLEIDGHDLAAVNNAIAQAKALAQADPRPCFIACRTIIAKGIARLEGQRGGHSARLFEDDATAMRKRFEWSQAPFDVPPESLKAWRDAGAQHNKAFEAWQARLQAKPQAEREAFLRVLQGEMPQSLPDLLSEYKKQQTEKAQSEQASPWWTLPEAVRQPAPINYATSGIHLSGAISDLLNDCLPEKIVACADLEAPTAHKRSLQAFSAKTPGGQYIHCGVREHAMAALCNGMAAHGGIKPVAVTYLAFADYQRASMRMAAMMGLPVLYVFSHDSIGIGRNGPTHQPVEIIASLRAMPNMLVMRPADAIEAAECWQVALEQRSTPSSLIFARQELPTLRHLHAANARTNLAAQGAYVLVEAERGASHRDLTLLATGSEVALALAAHHQLTREGIASAVVSMPCWELFEQQSETYRSAVLGKACPRVAVEAAVQQGWERYIGSQDAFIGMTGFGASGPADQLYERYGITVQAIVNAAQALVGSTPTEPISHGASRPLFT